jgi:hypothetical protein
MYPPEHIRKALSVERLGGKCLLNLCAGGETLLSNDIIPVIKELLEEGHYLEIVTNGTLTKRFDEIVTLPPNLIRHLIFKFSFHYLELKRLGFIDKYFENIKKVQEAGCSFTVEMTPNDELIPYIDEIKQVCMDKLNTLCHLTIARDDTKKGIPVLSKHSFDEYKKIWGTFNSDLFEFKSRIFYKRQKNKFCYAGAWSFYFNLVTGDAVQCYAGLYLQNIYKDVTKPIKSLAVGNNCKVAHCYNGHNLLVWGTIPDFDSPTYADMRNRKTENNTEWLGDDVKSFLSGKLAECNEEYNNFQKFKINVINNIKWFNIAGRLFGRLYRKVKRFIKKQEPQ